MPSISVAIIQKSNSKGNKNQLDVRIKTILDDVFVSMARLELHIHTTLTK